MPHIRFQKFYKSGKIPVYMKMTSHLAKFTYFWISFLAIELGWYGAKWLEYPYPQIRSKSNKIYILAPRWAHCISQCQFLSNFCFFRVTVRSHFKDGIVISKRNWTGFRQNFKWSLYPYGSGQKGSAENFWSIYP